MAMVTDASLASEIEVEGLAFAREVLRIEAEAIERVRDRLGDTITRAAELIYRSSGSVIVTGMGKAGLVGQKLAATLASTGTRAFPLHPAEAVHGDLGRIRADDIVIALSQSGETEEVLRLIPALRRLGALLIAITERATSSLGRAADLCVALGPIEEACPAWIWRPRPAQLCSWPSAMPWLFWSARCETSPPLILPAITRLAAWAESSPASRRSCALATRSVRRILKKPYGPSLFGSLDHAGAQERS